MLPHPSHAAENFGRTGNGNIVLSGFEAEVTDTATPDDVPERIRFAAAVADYSQPKWGIAAALDGNPKTGWALDGNNPAMRADRHAVFLLDKPITLAQEGTLTVRVRNDAFTYHNIGRFRLAISGAEGITAVNATPTLPLVVEALATPAAERTDPQKQALEEHYRATTNKAIGAAAKATVDVARKAKATYESSLPTVMVMEEMPKPRDCFILVRGQYDQRGEQVSAALPSALPPLPADQPMNRLGLARG